MKLKNVKVGQVVEVKKSNANFYHSYTGVHGTVQDVEDSTYSDYLSVRVLFPDGITDWGNHKDIKLLEDVV